MNTAEKLAATYLRLNGFLLLPHFTIFTGNDHNHVDVVGFRPANSSEIAFGDSLPRDKVFSDQLSNELGNDSNCIPVGVIGESRSNLNRDRISAEHVDYVSSFLGGVKPVRVAFCQARTKIRRDERGLRVSLRYAYDWIQERITDLEQRWRGQRRLSKTGSWELSEEFLADLLWLRRINVH